MKIIWIKKEVIKNEKIRINKSKDKLNLRKYLPECISRRQLRKNIKRVSTKPYNRTRHVFY